MQLSRKRRLYVVAGVLLVLVLVAVAAVIIMLPKEPKLGPPLMTEHFDGAVLNSVLWEAQTFPQAYRNNEEQEYLPSQVAVRDGMLQITAERDEEGQWRSGIVHSHWRFAHGRFTVRMRMDGVGTGTWPAAWLMGTQDEWPSNGEIDIMENVDGTPNVYGGIHGGGPSGHWKMDSAYSPVDVTQWHTYEILKEPWRISWWIDGEKRAEWEHSNVPSNGQWPFEDHEYFGLLNIALGGDWPSATDASTPERVTMYVDSFVVTALP